VREDARLDRRPTGPEPVKYMHKSTYPRPNYRLPTGELSTKVKSAHSPGLRGRFGPPQNDAGRRPHDGKAMKASRLGMMIAVCGSAIAVLAFLALPLASNQSVSVTGLQGALDPRMIGPGSDALAVLLWLFLIGSSGSLCIAAFQAIRQRRLSLCRGTWIAAFSGAASLVYFGILVVVMAASSPSELRSAASVLGTGFFVSLSGSLVGVIGGRVASVATRTQRQIRDSGARGRDMLTADSGRSNQQPMTVAQMLATRHPTARYEVRRGGTNRQTTASTNVPGPSRRLPPPAGHQG
jgi:hypothetical protein